MEETGPDVCKKKKEDQNAIVKNIKEDKSKTKSKTPYAIKKNQESFDP